MNLNLDNTKRRRPPTRRPRRASLYPTLSHLTLPARREHHAQHQKPTNQPIRQVIYRTLRLRRASKHPPFIQRVHHAVALWPLEHDQRHRRDAHDRPNRFQTPRRRRRRDRIHDRRRDRGHPRTPAPRHPPPSRAASRRRSRARRRRRRGSTRGSSASRAPRAARRRARRARRVRHRRHRRHHHRRHHRRRRRIGVAFFRASTTDGTTTRASSRDTVFHSVYTYVHIEYTSHARRGGAVVVG